MLHPATGTIPRTLTMRLTSLIVAALISSASAMQPATRSATTAEGLIGSAVFYHGKPVVLQHAVVYDQAVPRLAGTVKPVYVFWKERPSTDTGEIRGEFWDLGRIESGDSRF